MTPHRILPAVAAAFALGCSSPSLPFYQIDATVRFVNVEGGCWSLVTSPEHKAYQPVDLPASFRIDSLAVRVVLRDAPDMASICMIGPLVHVDAISAR